MTANRRLRAADLALLAVGAPIWVPVMAACAAAVAVGSGRPVLFRQERIGRNGAPFPVLKFRSMRVADTPESPTAESVTSVGSVLRRTSLDELPQLLNVLRGDMSIVGPRPMLGRQVEALSDVQALRHDVRPGLTGLAQVNGRNAIPWADRLALDAAWAARPRLITYLQIVIRTFGTIATGAGVDGNDANDPFVRLAYGRPDDVVDLDVAVDLSSVPELDRSAA